ncbi:hypothetical protein [Pedobacter hartonius]|uniref:MFS transporter, DHA2 family, multidrug resistance protein n=1 Tax=Pedobacter hartonius TaxID=425514 RepID=A0A1H4BBT4_9SPHI|nr:hypothetical protein [Pedobacter hartonius]SEA45556.1 MFS transporter, DHA2 family, multidrug resistance protein [Pedobacter hartonius]
MPFKSKIDIKTRRMIAKGMNLSLAKQAAYGALDHSLSKHAQMQAYLDGFLLISIFFVCTILCS